MKVMMVDLDGTLFDTRIVNYKAYKQALNEYGYDIDFDFFCRYCNGRHYSEFLPRIVQEATVIEEIHSKKKQFYKHNLNEAVINHHLVNILKLSKGYYKIVLVTTASLQNTEDILMRFDIFNLFDLLITQESVKNKKPNSECYVQAMKHFNADPTDCIIFEDSDVGVSAARASKAYVCIVEGYS